MRKILCFLFCLQFISGLTQDTLSICSFNIQFLGHFKSRENAVLAEILKDHDIVVVQEMVAPPIQGIFPNGEPFNKDKESADFVVEMEKNGFSYWLSPEDTGPSKNHTPTSASEWWIVFYKNKRVLPDTNRCYGFVSSPLTQNEIYERVPYAFPFKSVKGNSNFTFVSVHLKPGDSKVEKEIRQKELNELFTWISTPMESNKDFYVLGDFNIYTQSEFIAYKQKGISSLNEACLKTNSKWYESESKGQPYDHVFHNTYSSEDILENSFEVIDLRKEIIKVADSNQFVLDPYSHDDFRTKFSDHLPVSFKLITGRDTDL